MSALLEWLWFANLTGPAASNTEELLSVYGSPRGLLDAASSEDLSPWLTKNQMSRLWAKPEEFEKLAERCERSGIRILTQEDEDYPAKLLGLADAPAVLYCTGDPRVLGEAPSVGMIGSRRPSQYGAEAAAFLGKPLARAGAVIVSGLADGLDGLCHQAAIDESAPTAAFLGTAINKTYPASNRILREKIEDYGAVFSEFGPDVMTGRSGFLQRNRLIAGACDALCVVEARMQSGTMNTVSHAQRYGRPIFAVPGPIFSPLCEGTNHLLECGDANAAPAAGPILACLGLEGDIETVPHGPKKQPPQISPTARTVLDRLGQTPRSVEAIVEGSGLSLPGVLAALMELELAGYAAACAGGQYRRK